MCSSDLLDIRRIGPIKVGDEVCGNRTRVKVVKNKLAPPFQISEFDIRYGSGIDAVGDLLDKAVERDIVKKSGSYYTHEGTSLGQGRERARERLASDAALRERIRARVAELGPRSTRTPAPEAGEVPALEESAEAAAA